MSIGLDIGSKTIKVIELAHDGNKHILRSAGAVGYGGSPIEGIEGDKAIAELATLIKKLFKDAKISSNKVSVSLPESQVFSRVIKFPNLNDAEIASAVKWEAEEYIPMPIVDAVLEHQIVERREGANPPEVLVLVVAVLRDLVEKYLEVLKHAGLEVLSLETEMLALTRSIAPPQNTEVILDIGSRSTNISIVKNKQLFLSRTVNTAGDAFTRSVAQSLSVTPAQAEQYKRAYGFNSDKLEGKVSAAMKPIIHVISEDIKKAIQYYKIEMKNEPPTSILLTGGSVGLPGITSILTDLLNMEVAIGDPFSGIEVDKESMASLAPYSPLYPIAVGLALRDM